MASICLGLNVLSVCPWTTHSVCEQPFRLLEPGFPRHLPALESWPCRRDTTCIPPIRNHFPESWFYLWQFSVGQTGSWCPQVNFYLWNTSQCTRMHWNDALHNCQWRCSCKGCQRESLTHWSRDKMAAISQTTFSNAFSWMKMYEFRFHWDFTEVCSWGSN